MPAAVLRFKQPQVPRQDGEQARLKVVQGPDYGTVYVLVGARASVGRGEENGIVISDLKASRRHAEFSRTPSGWAVKDLGSANGILYNGQASRSAVLRSGDTVTLGETTLEFLGGESATTMLVAPARTMGQVHQQLQQQQAFSAQKQKVNGTAPFGAPAGAQKAPGKSPILLIVGALAVGFLLLGNDDSAPKKKTAKKDEKEASRDLASFLPPSEPAANTRMINTFFQAGFREYRERNYLRAKQQFETVLQMSPAHALATIYLENSNKMIEEEVKSHLERGKRSLEAGKLKDSKGHFEAVKRLMFRDQSSPAFKEADEQLIRVQKAMNGEGTG